MEINEKLNNRDKYFFDLDNTIWEWDSTKTGAKELIERLKSSGKTVKYFTDNSLLSRADYAKKLSSMGIKTEKQDIFTVGYALGRHLSENMVNKAYVIGESGLMDDLQETGIEITEESETIVIGFDRQLNYGKINRAFEILQNGGRIYICSNELYFNRSNSKIPHQGAFNRIFDDFDAKEIAGKPSDIFVDQFENYFNFNRHNSVLIGDSLSDIETGNKLRITTGALMSGDLDKEKISEAKNSQRPDFATPNLHKLKRRIL